MENYQHLNQKTESYKNKLRLHSPFNKNIQIQNFFRVDSNMTKPKGKIYNINNKKEIHFTSRPKENEYNIKGPKILTINFPPEFMVSSSNSRKNSSHEKNIYLQKNNTNNNELNNLEKEGNKKFAETVKKDFEKLNEIKSNININNINNKSKKYHQKLILINLNKKEDKNKFQKKNNMFYTKTQEGESAPSGLVVGNNVGYNKSETELNKRKRKSSDDKDDLEKENWNNSKFNNNNIKTEGCDYEIHKHILSGISSQTNYKSDLNNNLNNFQIYKHQNNKQDYENNSYNNTSNISDNSKDKIINSYLNGPKNIFIVGNSNNKLVFNPSNINQRMKKINSESEYNPLYLVNKNIVKEYNTNIKYYNHFNSLYNNTGTNHLKSESFSRFSTSHEKNYTSHNNIKMQTELNNSPNYYESIINDIDYKKIKNQKNNPKTNSAIEYNKNILENLAIKKKLENINIGIAYKMYNGYKFYFNLPNEQIYILKEVSYSCGKGLIPQIELWNKKYQNDSLYLKIYDHEINFNQRQIIWIIQYPIGGESINDIINSVGFYDQNYLFDFVTKIYKIIVKIKEDKENKKYKNVPFCICDIFINVNEHIKIIPPLIRQIPLDSNFDKNSNYENKKKHISFCKCRNNLKKILDYYEEDSISFFCLGFAIMQTITQNLIFDMSSYKYTLNVLKTNKKNISKDHCCFAHLLLNIEKTYFNNQKYLLFSNFLNLYPKSLLSLLHECTNFKNNNVSSSNEFLNLYDTNKNLNLSMKEILDITTTPENTFIKFETFLSDFEILFKDIKINPEIYLRKLNSNKVIHVLSRTFGLDKEIFRNKLKEKIGMNLKELNINDNNDKYDINENDENGNKFNLNNNNNDITSLFIGYNKRKKEGNDNIFNKQNHSNLIHNYIHSSENNYD